jgi:hypothetical protein
MKLTITWYFKATIEACSSLIGQLGVDKVWLGYAPWWGQHGQSSPQQIMGANNSWDNNPSWCHSTIQSSLLLFLIDFGVSLAISWYYYALATSLVLRFCLLGFISLFSRHIFFILWALDQYVCIVCYTFNNYLTTLFDVYCMLSQSIRCMWNLPAKCILHLASHFYQYV